MIAIYNPNSDLTLQYFPLPIDTEIAEFDDIAGFLQFLSYQRNRINRILLPLSIQQGSSLATPENTAIVRELFPHHNHHRNIISGTYGTTFASKSLQPGNSETIDTNQGRLLVKLLIKDYRNAVPDDVGELVGRFSGKVTLIVPQLYESPDHQKKLNQYFRGLDIDIKSQKLS